MWYVSALARGRRAGGDQSDEGASGAEAAEARVHSAVEDKEEYDVFKHSHLRYLGYANELGESFRPVHILRSTLYSDFKKYMFCGTEFRDFFLAHTSPLGRAVVRGCGHVCRRRLRRKVLAGAADGKVRG
jgi:hypothetical protein